MGGDMTEVAFDELAGFRHEMVEVGDAGGLRLHVAEGGDPQAPAIVLLPGFPQSWWAWRKVAPRLAATHRVIVMDLPGMGHSERPEGGYDTETIAGHVRAAVRKLSPARYWVVGHDIGAWVTVPYALTEDDPALRGVAVLDAGIPGISMPDSVPLDPERAVKLWHFAFHVIPDLPETLVAGRERDYVAWFLTRKSATPGAIGEEDIDRYARLFAAPGAFAAALGYYRSAAESARRTEALLKRRRIAVPVLAVSSDRGSVPDMAAAVRPAADDVTAVRIAGSGHYIPEEQPEALAAELTRFIDLSS
jgi:pimeloyl-ACP methyl ester carboxylesterase